MQGNNNQVMTHEESLVLKRTFARLRFCDSCGDQLFNDGHEVTGIVGGRNTVCDNCFGSWVRTASY